MKKLPRAEIETMLARGCFCQKYDYATGTWNDVPPHSKEA